ncbi:hypothetical protein [Promicromonospora sp. NPDC023805]|uniref:hypothetical protein n=1 Tax=Promicromonospora sp. NPDC023805 TaxID=3154696 RepID=UPI0033C59D59
MPYPVSPDAGVPEHQRDQRRPNSQWTGGQPPSGPFAASRPPSGQFPARPGAGQDPEPGWPATGPVPTGDGGSDGRRRKSGGRDRIWSVVAFLVAAAVIGAVGFYFFGPDPAEAPTATWAVDSCAGPDPAVESTEGETDTYRALPCDDPGATVTVLDIQDVVSVGQLHCPEGTDLAFQKDGHAGGETQAVCARNLSDDHPGDPGMGGGQLMAGDCVDKDGAEVACSSDGARPVTGLTVGGVECPEGSKDELRLGFDAQRSYETICLGA